MIIAAVVLSVIIVPSGAALVLAWLDRRPVTVRGCMCRLGSVISPEARAFIARATRR